MGRHAYLTMVHDRPEQFKKLLRLLDDERNDIFVHIDGKAGIPGGNSRYHLLSGRDLPLHVQDYIHDFMDRQRGRRQCRNRKIIFKTEWITNTPT